MSREQHTLALVKLATRSIETKLFLKKFEHELILSFHPRQEYLSTTSVGLQLLMEIYLQIVMQKLCLMD